MSDAPASPDLGEDQEKDVNPETEESSEEPSVMDTMQMLMIQMGQQMAAQGQQMTAQNEVIQELRGELSQMRAERQQEKKAATSIKVPANLREDVAYLRMKPQDKARGYVRARQFIDELNCVVKGGTGRLGDVPTWYEVEPEMAGELEQKYRQGPDFHDPRFPPLFDVANAEQRAAIDAAEESMRKASIGFGTPEDTRTKGVQARSVDTIGGGKAAVPKKAEPEMAPAAKAFAKQDVPIARTALPETMSGRSAALEGLEAGPPPGEAEPAERGEIQDLSVELPKQASELDASALQQAVERLKSSGMTGGIRRGR